MPVGRPKRRVARNAEQVGSSFAATPLRQQRTVGETQGRGSEGGGSSFEANPCRSARERSAKRRVAAMKDSASVRGQPRCRVEATGRRKRRVAAMKDSDSSVRGNLLPGSRGRSRNAQGQAAQRLRTEAGDDSLSLRRILHVAFCQPGDARSWRSRGDQKGQVRPDQFRGSL